MLVVYTGGTFGMQNEGRGLEAKIDLSKEIAELVASANHPTSASGWRYVALKHVIDSADASLDHAFSIAALIRSTCVNIKGVVVVHGTDTLTYSAAVAAFALDDLQIPIVFTGAQRPLGEAGSDAAKNFVEAYRDASDGTPGVRIVFGGRVLPAVRAIKFSTDADEAFVAHRPVAPGATGMAAHTKRLELLARSGIGISSADVPATGLLRVFPGLNPALIRAASVLYPGGLVLECYGAGTGPTSTPGLSAAVAAATSSGTPIIAITQCQTGSVELDRYAAGAALRSSGAWGGFDLTTDAALAKLGVLNALGLEWNELRAAFALNLVGEQLTGQIS